MSFGWPLALLGLLAVPALAAAYLWQLRRRRREAVPYSSVALIRAAVPTRSAWRRHVPIALLLAALACLGIAGSRPQVQADVPVSSSAVILAVDVSGSMCANDVSPNRLAAAQDAVRDFVRAQDGATRIGLVVFSGFAQVAVPPTTDHDSVLQSIDNLTTGRGTTIGAAILKSIDAISEINPDVPPVGADSGTAPDAGGAPPPTDPPSDVATAPEIVVLLTDGANTRGITPEEAAEEAAARGVRVYPIGFGTTNPTQLVCTREQLGGNLFDGFGRGGFGGMGRNGRNFLIVDEDALRQVATTTGGAYFAANDADQLQGVLEDLPRHVQVQQRDIEVSVGFAGLGALLVLFAGWAAARWSVFPN
jgi:Ca-activated chloride channel family protein